MNKTICNLYITIWCLYALQGTLYSSGSIISRFLLVFFLSFSLFFFVLALYKYKLPSVLRILAVLIGVWTIYGGINILFGNKVSWVNNYEYLKSIYLSLLPIYAFYVFAKKGVLTDSLLRYWTVVFVPVIIAYYYHMVDLRLQEGFYSNSRDEFANSAAYSFVSILPLVPLFYKKPFVQYVLIGICMVFILMGMKRGALLTGSIAVIWFLFTSLQGKNEKQHSKQFWRVLFTGIIILVAVIVVRHFLTTSELFNARVEQTLAGDSSGRDRIFTSYSQFVLNDMSFLDLLIGKGADGTVRIFGQYAHNDWLEIAIDNGLIVTLLFGLFIIKLFLTSRQSHKSIIIHQILGLFFISFFFKTLFSMSYNEVNVCSSSAFAYALAMMEKGSDSV